MNIHGVEHAIIDTRLAKNAALHKQVYPLHDTLEQRSFISDTFTCVTTDGF